MNLSRKEGSDYVGFIVGRTRPSLHLRPLDSEFFTHGTLLYYVAPYKSAEVVSQQVQTWYRIHVHQHDAWHHPSRLSTRSRQNSTSNYSRAPSPPVIVDFPIKLRADGIPTPAMCTVPQRRKTTRALATHMHAPAFLVSISLPANLHLSK